jgi:hypothetical protein
LQRLPSGSDYDAEGLPFSLRQLVRQGVPDPRCHLRRLLVAAGRFAGEEASFAASFFLILVTVPWLLLMPSPVDLPSGWPGEVIFFGGPAVSALINAAVISLVEHAVGRLIRSRA